MRRFLSVLHGDAKYTVAALGHSGMFFDCALKLLKKDFRNQHEVLCEKLKAFLGQPKYKKTLEKHQAVIIKV